MKDKVKNSRIQSQLSVERTKLANRRTLLAYLRSAVGLVVAGAGLMKFITEDVWVVVGICCIILAPIIMIVGIIDYIHVKKLIKAEKEYLETTENSTEGLN